MSFGYVPERLLHGSGTPRLLFLPIVSGLMAATCLGLAFGGIGMLYPLAAMAGFAFGEERAPLRCSLALGALWGCLLYRCLACCTHSSRRRALVTVPIPS